MTVMVFVFLGGGGDIIIACVLVKVTKNIKDRNIVKEIDIYRVGCVEGLIIGTDWLDNILKNDFSLNGALSTSPCIFIQGFSNLRM